MYSNYLCIFYLIIICTYVCTHIVPPTIEVTKSKYISTIGSSVTLTCRITNHGRPVADFAWKRNGMWLPNDSVSVNSTHFSLTLSNLTDADAGIYRCAAQGVLTTPIENVNLIIRGTLLMILMCL